MSDFINNARLLPYNRELKERARYLRNNQTEYEKKLWFNYLRELDIHFYRQKPIANYIVDFYAPKLKLVIEIDGDSHYTNDGIEYDKQRTILLNSYKLIVIRFRNDEIKDNFEAVCECIATYIQQYEST